MQSFISFYTMKKNCIQFTTGIVSMLLGIFVSNAQIVHQESFEGGQIPGTWLAPLAGFDNQWDVVQDGTNPDQTPHTGSYQARFNSYSISSGESQILVTPSFDLRGRDTSTVKVSFWLYRDDYISYLTNADRVNVYINTSNTLTAATSLGTVHRSIALAPIVTSGGWKKYEYVVPPSFNGIQNYLILEGYSGYGNRTFVDDVQWTEYLGACIGNPVAGVLSSDLSDVNKNDTITLTVTGTTQGTQVIESTNNLALPFNAVGIGSGLQTVPAYTSNQSVDTFYYRIKSSSPGCVDALSDTIMVIVRIPLGEAFGNPIVAGNNPVNYNNTQNTGSFSNDYTTSSTPGGIDATDGNDIFYKFTLTDCKVVEIGQCNTIESFGAYVQLLDSAGVNIASEGFNCPSNGGGYIKKFLQAGTYYVVSELSSEFSTPGDLTLTINCITPSARITQGDTAYLPNANATVNLTTTTNFTGAAGMTSSVTPTYSWANAVNPAVVLSSTANYIADTVGRYILTVKVGDCTYTDLVVVSIPVCTSAAIAGIISSNVMTTFHGDSARLVLRNYLGNIQWQRSYNSTLFSLIPGTNDTINAVTNIATTATSDTVYFRAAVNRPGCTALSYSDTIMVIINERVGDRFTNPILVGLNPANYLDTQYLKHFRNLYTATSTPGNASAKTTNDIFYKFTTNKCFVLEAGHCSTFPSGDSYIHLLDATGANIINQDYGCNSSFDLASVNQVLPAGTYYIVTESGSSNTLRPVTAINLLLPSVTIVQGDTYSFNTPTAILNANSNIPNVTNQWTKVGQGPLQSNADGTITITEPGTYIVSTNGCSGVVKDTVVVVEPTCATPLVAGIISSSLASVPSNDSVRLSSVNQTGTSYWQYSYDGVNYIPSTFPNLAAVTANPVINGSNYIDTIYYRLVSFTPGCQHRYSNEIGVEITSRTGETFFNPIVINNPTSFTTTHTPNDFGDNYNNITSPGQPTASSYPDIFYKFTLNSCQVLTIGSCASVGQGGFFSGVNLFLLDSYRNLIKEDGNSCSSGENGQISEALGAGTYYLVAEYDPTTYTSIVLNFSGSVATASIVEPSPLTLPVGGTVDVNTTNNFASLGLGANYPVFYNWVYAGNSIATTPSITVSDEGMYIFEATLAIGCTIKDTIITEDYLAIEELDNNSFAFYPNPATDKLNVTFKNPLIQNTRIQVIDLVGRILVDMPMLKGDENLTVPTSTLANGLYYIQVTTSKNKYTAPFIKQ